MLIQSGIGFGDFDILNFKELSSGQVLDKLREDYNLSEGEAHYEVQHSALEVPAWFPVVEQSRCTLCGKCARFCLFGVYRFNKKNLEVVNPLSCKNNCPACGQTCPSFAIMFPRLVENSVLAGTEPGEIKSPNNKENLFVLLNKRNQNRKDIFKLGLIFRSKKNDAKFWKT